MLVKELVSPRRVIASFAATAYGTTLLFSLCRTSIWPYFAGVAILFAVYLADVMDFPYIAIWPAFPGVLLITTSIGGLFGYLRRLSIVPVSHSMRELWLVLLFGVGLVWWSIRTARQLMKRT